MFAIKGLLACCFLVAVLASAAPPRNQTNKPKPAEKIRKPSNFTSFKGETKSITAANSTAELGCGLSIYSGSSNGENEEDPSEVIGGKEALPGQFPWIVKLLYNGTEFLCGGSIIGPYYILTAAHCLHDCESNKTFTERELSIRAGAHEYNTTNHNHGQSYEVERVIVHENYCAVKFLDDIGLVKLRNPISFSLTEDGFGSMNAVCMPQPGTQYEDGETFRLAGWGLTWYKKSEIQLEPDFLQRIQVPHMEDGKCKRTFAALGPRGDRINFQPELEICAGGKENEGSCKGDSGGPLMRPSGGDPAGAHELVGLVSRAFPCSQKGLPTVYAQVDSYLDWINDNSCD